jgi:succinate-semialdehyde dehydrogenase/glutarate-semialdehyde dehydrogenase
MDLGAMIHDTQVKKVHAHVQDAVKKGAKVLVGGEIINAEQGSFYAPTVLIDVDHTMKVMTEETFGPIMPIMTYKDEEEALKLANDSPFGLSASIFTKDIRRGERLARQIQAGSVTVNDCCYSYGLPQVPWGGMKDSGVGVTHSKFGLYEFVQVRHIGSEHLAQMKKPYWYPYSEDAYGALRKATSLMYSDNIVEGALRAFSD